MGTPLPDAGWAIAQLVPSPEIASGGHGTSSAWGLRWQITPVLWSFGVNRRTSPWRAFIAEPLVRQSGSIEAYVSPEWIGGRWTARPGVRTYLPVEQHGDYLSVSFGSSYVTATRASAFEVGAYVLFGVVGLQLTVSPTRGEPPCIVTLRVRYF